MNFEKIKSDFENYDGDLLEIKINELDFFYWIKLIQFLQEKKINYGIYVYDIEYKEEKIKNDISLDFFKTNLYNSVIKIFINNQIQINCHLFDIEEIALNFDPRQVNSEENFNLLLLFISELSEHLKKNSLICHELLENNPIFYYDVKISSFLKI